VTEHRPTIDLGPCQVKGAINVARVRVLWEAGVLYVVRSLQDVTSVACPEQPGMPRGPHNMFHAATEAGLIKFRRAGCTCSYSLGNRSGFALMDQAKPLVAAQSG
jgi:hypothetical protein